jgi:hypothetical protein
MAFEVPEHMNPLAVVEQKLCEIFNVPFIFDYEEREVRKAFRPRYKMEKRKDGRYVRDENCQVCAGKKEVGQSCPECTQGHVFKYITCPKCLGKGKKRVDPEKNCNTCMGSGEIQMTEPCKACKATGYSKEPPMQTCPRCEGRGYRIALEHAHPYPVHEIIQGFFEFDFNHAYAEAERIAYRKAYRQKKHWYMPWSYLHGYHWDDTPNTEMYMLTVKFSVEKLRKWVPEVTPAQAKAIEKLYMEALAYKYDAGFHAGYMEGRYAVMEGRESKYRLGGDMPD